MAPSRSMRGKRIEGASDQYFVSTIRGVTLLRSEEFDLVDATGLRKLAQAVGIVSSALLKTVFDDLSLSHDTERRQWVPRRHAGILARQLRLSERILRPLLQRDFPDAPLEIEEEDERQASEPLKPAASPTPAPPAQRTEPDDGSIGDFYIATGFDPIVTGGATFEPHDVDHHMTDAWVPTPSFSPSEMLLLSLAESGLRRRCSVRPCDCSSNASDLLKIGFDGSAFWQSFGPVTAHRKLTAASGGSLPRPRIHHLSSLFDGPDVDL